MLHPNNPSQKAKRNSYGCFLLIKIIMIRDRLRVMEQRAFAHDKLTEDKISTVPTRIYGSLTTFNVLF